MNYRTTYILFGILVAILVLVGVAWWFEPANEETGKYLLPSANGKVAIKSDAVVKVQIDRTRPEQQTITLERDAESKKWQITAPHALHASTSNVEEMVRQLLSASAESKADTPPNLKAAELDPPAEVVTMTTKEGKELKVNVGTEGSLGTVVYLSSSDKPAAPAPVAKSSVSSLFKTGTNAQGLKDLSFFRDPYLLASATSDYKFVKLTLTKADKKDEPKGPMLLDKKDAALWEYRNAQGYDGSAEEGEPGVRLEAGKERQAGVEGLLKELSSMQVASGGEDQPDYVADEVTDLGQYNLAPAKSDVLTIDVDRIESIGKDESGKPKTQTASVTALIGVGKKIDEKDKAAKYYAAVKGEKGYSVVKISTEAPDAVALLFKDPTYLCNHNLAALGAQQPLALDVETADGKLEFRREKGLDPWQMYRDGKDVTPDKATVDALVNQLVQPAQVRAFLDPKTVDADKLGLTKPVAKVSIWVDGVTKEEEKKEDKPADKPDEKKDEKKEEKKPKLVLAKDKIDKPAARLTFGAVEGEDAVVKREANHVLHDGGETKDWSESVVVKAPKPLEDQAKASPLTYYDKQLPKFAQGFDFADPALGVVKLELDRGAGDRTVVSRPDVKAGADGKALDWKFEVPPESTDRKVDALAVQGILNTLNNLHATSLVAEAPKDEDLDKVYGLKTPTLKAIVTRKDDKNSPYTDEFGKDAPDGGVYARQGQRPTVFIVSKIDFEALKKDLRDRTVFPGLDTAKVKGLKLTGWVAIAGTPQTLEFEKTGDQWTAKSPKDFMTDPEKIKTLFNGVSRLVATQVVTKDDKIKPAFDKDEEKSALTIEMTVEGQDKPLQLRVVNLTGDKSGLPPEKKGYYASSLNSPNLPGEVFSVSKETFEGPMSKPAYFTKP